MIKTLKRFFENIERIANVLAANPMQDVLVTLRPEQLKELPLYQKRKPNKQKEVQ